MRGQIFNGRDSVSKIVFLLECKATSDGENVHNGTSLLIFKYNLSARVESIIKAHIVLPTETPKALEGWSTLYIAIVYYLWK